MRVRYSFGSRHTGKIENISKQRRKYPDVVSEIIQICDIILEVLDARFINETRNIEFEEQIKGLGKKIIYVLNKCDLADVEAKRIELRKLGLYPYVFVSCRKRIGGRELRSKVKMEAKRIVLPEDDMKRVQVGIIGYPNTGKSSLINFLTGTSAAKVGAEAGFTKGMQRVKLTSEILILDTPGVIPKQEYSSQNQEAITKYAKVGARDYSKVRNPEQVVNSLMLEYGDAIEKYYSIEAMGDSEKVIEEIGKRRNFLKKGGIVHEDRAARSIIRDWQDGKIKV